MRFFSLLMILLLVSSCANKAEKAKQGEESIKQEYILKGAEIVGLTQAELMKNVGSAMNAGGPGHAVEFCNLRAMLLMDSLSQMNNCEIRRISEKYRNPIDKPQTKTEEKQLNQYKDAFKNGKDIYAEVHIFEDRIEYYQPITINNGTCLLCHGEPGTQIAAQTLETLKERYPDDLATGFALNDFRGAWKITF